MKRFLYFTILIGVFCFCSRTVYGQEMNPLLIVGSAQNDVVNILKQNGISFSFASDATIAIETATPHTAIFLFAEDYPDKRVSLSRRSLKQINKKKLHVYIEYPDALPGLRMEEAPKTITLERGVVLTSSIAGLDSLDLLGINDHRMIQTNVANPLLVVAKVAGYDQADYGLEGTDTYPLLFQHGNFLVATTKLSDVIHSRFGPATSWQKVWEFILRKSNIVSEGASLKWIPDVRPSYNRTDSLPHNAFAKSIEKGTQWFYNARLFIHPTWQDTFLQRTSKNGEGVVYPAISPKAMVGDGSLGILEGHASFINADGSQPIRWWLRADCQAEVAFALTSSSSLLSESDYQTTARHLLDHLYKQSNLRQGERNDPASPSFGLIGWATTDPDAYYGDDNARVILATIGAAANLDTDDWDTYIIEGILGNFRTAGIHGFRGPWFRDAAMQKTTWQKLSERDITNVHPHYESWLWACYLWLYDKTHYKPLLDKAKEAISMTMEAYPDWKWTNGIQQEYARMLLPLAWLVRVDDTEQHRAWLDRIANKLLEDLQDCGAIREELGRPGMGRYDRIGSNAEYGTKEAPLISSNGDPVADLLYTMNFAFFTLNEAAHATQNPLYAQAVDKIAAFMMRIQVNSPSHTELDGAWFRAFDYNRWDYWASNADSGWGPWGTLTGWTQSWIINSLILHAENENFWENSQKKYKENEPFKKMTQEKIHQMMR